ncbi:hypothetical protein Tco_0482395 [Tanacetum coccineum]
MKNWLSQSKRLLICGMVAVTEPNTMQKAVQISGVLTDKAEERIQVLGPSVPLATPTMHLEGFVAHASTVTAKILPQAVYDLVNPVIEKNVAESLEAAVLKRSSS